MQCSDIRDFSDSGKCVADIVRRWHLQLQLYSLHVCKCKLYR